MRTRGWADVRRGRRGVVLLLLSGIALAAMPATAVAGDSVKVFVMDRCEPDSFDAAIEPGTCLRNGGVTFDNFVDRLNPKDGGHNAWRNSRREVVLTGDQRLTLINSGGEVHSFTEVFNFGTGFVDELNAALPAGTPPAEPVPGDPHFLAAGETVELNQLSPGTHLFECLIHPWMRTVAEQN
jgi:hypothetical protein